MQPLAEAAGLRVEVDGRLAEGTDVTAMALLRAPEAAAIALCTHGDVVPRLLDRLADEDGLTLPPAPRWEKGSVWVLTGASPERYAGARYLPPPAVGV